jgi:hypothetical protein
MNWRDEFRKLRKEDKEFSSDLRKHVFKDYVFNKNLFRLCLFLVLALASYSVYLDGFGGEYFVCHSVGYDVVNEIYCSFEGELFGDLPSDFTRNVNFFIFVVVLSFLFLNHLLFNRRKRK